MNKKEAIKIVNKIEKILYDLNASGEARNISDAVNWGDLHVVEINTKKQIWPHEESKEIIEVLIEEADPYSYNLRNHIFRKLKEENVDNIEIRTEW